MRDPIARRPAIAAFAALAFALVIWCGAAAHAAAVKLRVGTPALAFSFVPVNIGIEKGFFAQHGLDVTLVTLSGAGKVMQAAASDSIDIVVGAGSDFAFIRKGVPLVGIAEMAGPPNLFGIVVGKGSHIRSVDDLRGKRIGVSTVGSVTEWLALELARQKGWGPHGVIPVALGAGSAIQAAALKVHEVDAVVGTVALGLTLEEKGAGRLLLPASSYVGDCVIHMIEAQKSLIARDPAAVRNFLAGWFETIAFMRAHKAETVALARQVTGFDENVESREYDIVMPMFSADGRFKPKALANLHDLMVRNHIIAANVDFSKLYTERFLPRS